MTTARIITRMKPPTLAGRMAAVLVERTLATGACTFQDLRRAGFSRREIHVPGDLAED
jgi:hypothetical protein